MTVPSSDRDSLGFTSSASQSESDRLRTTPVRKFDPAGRVWALLRAGKAGRGRPAAEPARLAGVAASPLMEVTGTGISLMVTPHPGDAKLVTTALSGQAGLKGMSWPRRRLFT